MNVARSPPPPCLRIHRTETKLARVSQHDALEPWDPMLNRITADEAHALLESINAAMASASMDNDGGLNLQQLQQHVLPAISMPSMSCLSTMTSNTSATVASATTRCR
ncbi:Os08g0354201 [Oryza sativa Japonica Group]|uniref:Os08g0354201 protein n=1 Tax=Oryza sativa subsp. japonica TaxID=39947 RepID=A0A0P0XEN9_ORYSJ|nr:Os08g0354201 [Oryza sativa Japonica Group]